MKFLKSVLLITGILFSSALLGAQETSPLRTVTIEEAVALALENNISLSSSAIDVRMAKRDADLAWNVFLPAVQASGTLARSNNADNPYAAIMSGLPGYTPVTPTEKDHWSAMVGLNISLNLNVALMEGLKATRQSYEAGKLTYEQAKAQTEQSVRKAFYAILLAEGSLDIGRDKLSISEERLNQTKINFANGLVSELAYLQTQLSVETQKPEIREAELNLEQQKNMFAFLLGLPEGTRISLDGKIEPNMISLDADQVIGKNMANRLDIAILGKNIELMNTQLRAAKLQTYTPSVALSQSYLPRLSAIDASWTNADNWTDSSGAFSVTVAFNLTGLFPLSAAGQSLAKTQDGIRKMELSMKQLSYNADMEIRNLIKKLDKSQTAIAARELNVSIAEKAYRLTEQGYRAGTIEYLDLKDAESSLLQARLGVLSEKFTYLTTMLDLETALNTKLN